MGVKNIDVRIQFQNLSGNDAQIIQKSLEPDNIAHPPIKFDSRILGQVLEIKIQNISKIETAKTTILDILVSYDLNEKVLENLKDIT